MSDASTMPSSFQGRDLGMLPNLKNMMSGKRNLNVQSNASRAANRLNNLKSSQNNLPGVYHSPEARNSNFENYNNYNSQTERKPLTKKANQIRDNSNASPQMRKGSLQDAMNDAQTYIKSLQKSKQIINGIKADTVDPR
jgi:hypothetical protein